jgi:hypothetical protein
MDSYKKYQFCLNSKYYSCNCTENTSRITGIKKRTKVNSCHKLHRYPSSFLFLVPNSHLVVVYWFTECHVCIVIQCCNLTYGKYEYCYYIDKNFSLRPRSNKIEHADRVQDCAAVQTRSRLFWFDTLRNSRDERTPQLNHLTISGVQFASQFM